MIMRNLLVTIKYDGTAYHGYQVQSNAITIQAVLQNALEKIFSKRPDVTGCSRTDSGVHANMYCFTIQTDMSIPCDSLVYALNGYLPKDIAAYDCREVACDFHPRYSCKSKEYVYKIYNADLRDPFLADYSYYYRRKIDADYLNQEAKFFVGTYDYSGFCSVKSDVENTVRTVKSFEVVRDGDMVIFKVEADGFLYNMVRIMIGTLLFVSEGKIKQGELKDIILSKDRKKAGKTAPPQGLYLNKVNY